MNLTAQECGAINVTLTSQAPEASDREAAKEIYALIRANLDPVINHFVGGEIELTVTHRACLLKLLPMVPWLTPQLIEFVDPLIAKLNA